MIWCARKWLEAVLVIVLLGAVAGCSNPRPSGQQRAKAAPREMPASVAHDYRDQNFDYFVVGNPNAPRATHTTPGLALMGGGGSVDAAFQFIAAHAGRGHIVILAAVGDNRFEPTAARYGEHFMHDWGPVTSAETIVFHNRKAAYDKRVITTLRGADGVFLAGGDQANYIRYWKGTPVQAALNTHLRAARPIGGSSAGLAVLGHFSYTAMDGGSVESKTALADPLNAGITIEDDFLHAHWLNHVITDTHFSQRHRLGRLIAFLARIRFVKPHSAVLGIGIDEHSALLVGAGGAGQLANGSLGNAWLVVPREPAKLLSAGQPLSISDVDLLKIGPASRVDFPSGKVQHPAAEATLSIVRGALVGDSIATPILTRELVPLGEG